MRQISYEQSINQYSWSWASVKERPCSSKAKAVTYSTSVSAIEWQWKFAENKEFFLFYDTLIKNEPSSVAAPSNSASLSGQQHLSSNSFIMRGGSPGLTPSFYKRKLWTNERGSAVIWEARWQGKHYFGHGHIVNVCRLQRHRRVVVHEFESCAKFERVY